MRNEFGKVQAYVGTDEIIRFRLIFERLGLRDVEIVPTSLPRSGLVKLVLFMDVLTLERFIF